MERVERLTNLLALLLETREPLTLQHIARELAGQYSEKEENRRAAFERDKAALRDIGVPIETEILSGHQAGATGYRIDRKRYELGDLELEPDERRALQIAVAGTGRGRRTSSASASTAGSSTDSPLIHSYSRHTWVERAGPA